MNQINTFLIALAGLLAISGTALAQSGPHAQPTSDQGELVLGASARPIVVFRNVPTKWMLNVIDVRTPCARKGNIRLVSKDCSLQNFKEGRFQLEVPGEEGSLAVYLELEDRVVEVATLAFQTIEADTNNADFLSAYPNGSWKKHLAPSEPVTFGNKTVVQDPNYVLDMPMPMIQSIQTDRPNRIHALFTGGCSPWMSLKMDAEGATVSELSSWNDFNVIPEKGVEVVKLKVWTEKDGNRQDLESVVLRVESVESKN